MYMPRYSDVTRSREMVSVFGGYNHNLSCADGEFYEMSNMTSKYYPVLSPRAKRGICKVLRNPQGMIEKDGLVWIDDGVLYVDGEEVSGPTITTVGEKTIAKMGAYVVVFPDKVWYNLSDGTSGTMESRYSTAEEISFSLCDMSGRAITWHDEAYYKENAPESGDYLMSSMNGTATLKQWSSSTSVWVAVNSTYIQIAAVGIGQNFKKGDGVKITVDLDGVDWADAKNIFVNDEGDGKRSINTYIQDITEDCITIVGIIAEAKELSLNMTVAREVPEMSFVTECNNRLWGCSADGHEIYCCKLGDVTNWNAFAGVSTDSWAATIGSDGVFTGAVTFLGQPIFFKEDSMIKVVVSNTGAHRTLESYCRGVQNGSHKSLCIVNEVLYYKAADAVCAYSGSQPMTVSAHLGDVVYSEASAGALGDLYYISMKDKRLDSSLFVYDTRKGVWCKEDNMEARFFCRHGNELYVVDAADNFIKSVGGTLLYGSAEERMENTIQWSVESGNIGFTSPDNKFVGRINLRLSMEFGSIVDFYLQYDSSGSWEHVFNMHGKGTKTFTIPVIPHRCDHFKYKISGLGDCKIHSVTRTVEEGSDN